jgi:hypothetical protein
MANPQRRLFEPIPATAAGPNPFALPVSRRPPPTPPSIVDGYADLLELLGPGRRRGLIAWLSVRYYDGYRPSRSEIADLIAVELGTLTVDESLARQRQRDRGDDRITDITPYIMERYRQYHALPRSDAHTRKDISQ